MVAIGLFVLVLFVLPGFAATCGGECKADICGCSAEDCSGFSKIFCDKTYYCTHETCDSSKIASGYTCLNMKYYCSPSQTWLACEGTYTTDKYWSFPSGSTCHYCNNGVKGSCTFGSNYCDGGKLYSTSCTDTGCVPYVVSECSGCASSSSIYTGCSGSACTTAPCPNDDYCSGTTTFVDRTGTCSGGSCVSNSYDRDAAQAYCISTATGCTAQTWLNLDGNTGTYADNCCGDDGTSDNFALAGKASLCNAGTPRYCDSLDKCGTAYTVSGTTYYCEYSTSGQWVTQNRKLRIREGATQDSNDKACCQGDTYCVLNGVCYQDQNLDLSGTYVCNAGSWKLANGQACSTTNNQCYSTYCKLGLDGSTYCANKNQCVNGGLLYELGNTLCKGSTQYASCLSDPAAWVTYSCEGTSEPDGGNNPWVGSSASYGSGTCNPSTNACDAVSSATDKCADDKSYLTEYYVSEGTVTSQLYYPSQIKGCFTDSQGLKWYNTTSCISATGGDYLSWTQNDLDSDLYRTSQCANCGGVVTGTICCGDDANEYYKTGLGTPSTACCSASTQCAENGVCKASGSLSSSGAYICQTGTWVQATPDCKAAYVTSWYFALTGYWKTAGQASDSCAMACSNVTGKWLDGTPVSGSQCCQSDTKTSIVNSSGGQGLCDDTGWKLAPAFKGELSQSFYLSDGTIWNKCTTVGATLAVDGVTYICTAGGWQNQDCAIQGDTSPTICEQTCGKIWVGLGGDKQCCGDDASDLFVIDSTRMCAGTTGVNYCDTNCEKFTLNSSHTYYCYNGTWQLNPAFTGETLTQGYDNATGCCQYGQCWTGSCVSSGLYSGHLCSAGTWYPCDTSQLCQSLVVGGASYYCGDSGWQTAQVGLCDSATGQCASGACKHCGTDYAYGTTVNGLLCTSQGVFMEGCLSDEDCVTAEACKTGVCSAGQCVFDNLACGTPCNIGVCSGQGTCSAILGASQSCYCNGMCGEGLYCDPAMGVCIRSETCGDGICDVGECSACPQDCSLEDCSGDGVCNPSIGETCENSVDCSCRGKTCDPTSIYSDQWGCVIFPCGNGICETGECSTCPQDCKRSECAGNGKCDLAVGETCANSQDCICNVSITYGTLTSMSLGKSTTLSVFVENTGNTPMFVDLTIEGTSLDLTGGGENLYLAPGEKRPVTVTATPLSSGIQSIRVFANSGELGQVGEGILQTQVKSLGAWEELLVWFKQTPVFSFFEATDVLFWMASITGVIFAVFKKLTKPKKVNPYGWPMRNYYGNPYYRGYYHQQGGQFRGYYKGYARP